MPPARPSGMSTAARARASRGPLRTTALYGAGLMSGAALFLAGCSAGGLSGSGTPAAASPGGALHAPAGPANGSASSSAAQPAQATQADRLALNAQSIIYTASLTVQTPDVTAAASRASRIVTGEGGYVSSEQAAINPADHARSAISLQLKIPVAVYPATLATLSSVLGTQLSLTQHAQDVTQQVADVSSLVTSAQAAITQLQALLKRAGSVGDLLDVQEQINAQESSLEALLAQQRALAHETSYATVSVTLRGPHHAAKKAARRGGFLAGLGAGWRGLRAVVSAILTALGAVLPFAAAAAVLAGAGYAGRRRLQRLLRGLRRRSRPDAAG